MIPLLFAFLGVTILFFIAIVCALAANMQNMPAIEHKFIVAAKLLSLALSALAIVLAWQALKRLN